MIHYEARIYRHEPETRWFQRRIRRRRTRATLVFAGPAEGTIERHLNRPTTARISAKDWAAHL